MLTILKVALDFIGYPHTELDDFGANVAKRLTGHAVFTSPPVTAAELTTLSTAFHAAVLASYQGGVRETAALNTARAALEDALRTDAFYVQSLASHDMESLLSSGFFATSTNRTQAPLDPPVITDLENAGSGKLLLRLTPVANAKSYQIQTNTNGDGIWQEAGIYTQARRIVLTGLTPATNYNGRPRAMGGSTGYSEWCAPLPLMAT